MTERADIRIRDPFVVPVHEQQRYYLFGTTDPNCWSDRAVGFDAYWSPDLAHWEGPFAIFRPPDGFWADRQFWAPEVHEFGGRWFMFASFKADGVPRGTQVLISEKPEGPYVPHSEGRVTPDDWECLDATLFVDGVGTPWIVFCHEWVQVHDGEVCARKLSADLQQPAGDPVVLFVATDAPWVEREPGQEDFVTDGPFLYDAENGDLLMLWSSFSSNGYALGVARSAEGRLEGPWSHDPEPLYDEDGGHGMLFRTFEGQLMLTLHSPNKTPRERLRLLPVRDDQGQLRILQ